MDWLSIVVEFVKVVPALVASVRAIADEVEGTDKPVGKVHDTIAELEKLLGELKAAIPAA